MLVSLGLCIVTEISEGRFPLGFEQPGGHGHGLNGRRGGMIGIPHNLFLFDSADKLRDCLVGHCGLGCDK